MKNPERAEPCQTRPDSLPAQVISLEFLPHLQNRHSQEKKLHKQYFFVFFKVSVVAHVKLQTFIRCVGSLARELLQSLTWGLHIRQLQLRKEVMDRTSAGMGRRTD